MKKYLTGMLLITIMAAGCSEAKAQSTVDRQEAVLKTCSDIADLKAQILEMRRQGAPKKQTKAWVGNFLLQVPGITAVTVKGYQDKVDEIYAIPPFRSHNEVMGFRGILFQSCVEQMSGQ